jgi:hypothetical protein
MKVDLKEVESKDRKGWTSMGTGHQKLLIIKVEWIWEGGRRGERQSKK